MNNEFNVWLIFCSMFLLLCVSCPYLSSPSHTGMSMSMRMRWNGCCAAGIVSEGETAFTTMGVAEEEELVASEERDAEEDEPDAEEDNEYPDDATLECTDPDGESGVSTEIGVPDA